MGSQGLLTKGGLPGGQRMGDSGEEGEVGWARLAVRLVGFPSFPLDYVPPSISSRAFGKE